MTNSGRDRKIQGAYLRSPEWGKDIYLGERTSCVLSRAK